MSETNKAKVRTYICGKRSVDKALDLLKAEKIRKEKKAKDETDKYEKMAKYCTSTTTLKKKRNPCVAGFSHSYATSQMRSCIARHDWINLQRLIPLLLDYSTDKEPLVWRFTLAILLNSPESNATNIFQFLEKCIGSTNEIDSNESNLFLQRLLTLKTKLD